MPPPELRRYQADALQLMRDAITKKRLTRLLLSMPTGSGKGRVAQAIVNGSSGTVWFVAPRLEILDQLSRHLTEIGIAHGILRAGHGHDTTGLRVQVASMLTIRRRPGLTPPDIIIVDEAHLFYDAIVELRERFPNAIIIGMTATPCRLDGRGLGGVFETLIQTTSVGELIADGHLVSFRALAPPAPDMSSISTVAGEYHRGQAAGVFSRPAVIGNAVEHWQRHAVGRPTVVFCVDVEHSKQTVAQYLAAGIRAVHIDAETPLKVRRNTIDAFRAGDLEVVCNVELLTYGVDIPVIGCVQMLRPTKSLALLLQMLGRGLRPWPGKTELLILDHANNIRSHDVLPDTPIAWTLDGIDRRRSDAPAISVRTCEKCYAAYRATEPACPRCGHVNAPPAERAGVKTKDGTLEELSGSQLYGRQAGAEEAVRLLAKWGALAKINHWKPNAAHARFRGMFGRWPTLQEELAASVLGFPAYLVPGGKCKACACAGTTPGYKLGGPGGGSDNVAQIRCEGCNRWLAWVPKEFVSLLPVLGS